MTDKAILHAEWDRQLEAMLNSPLNRPTMIAKGNPKRLQVYYGFAKLTPKVMRKHELVIIYENANHNPMKSLQWILRKTHLVYIRQQTKQEMSDANNGNRIFTKYGYFIDEYPWCSNIDMVLEYNFLSDDKHVSKSERELIRVMLREKYTECYESRPCYQTALIFH
ncbi:hypothetical protein ATE84_2943 [Aquimarina sp. MAR_2010_214]|uniref:hypothetical protein n=1 Tax=Aquimarina sp. MAR_2010_214 TaxID=1250026 RepID=UPI000C707F07|nr:hypothetical protein [Aquimarina sp. MAR_2010_214]PKV50875.1 hypothetical protein ATE84_2943 [Aquimarina sp. MAR_2010_214]